MTIHEQDRRGCKAFTAAVTQHIHVNQIHPTLAISMLSTVRITSSLFSPRVLKSKNYLKPEFITKSATILLVRVKMITDSQTDRQISQTHTDGGMLMWAGVFLVVVADQVDTHFAHLSIARLPITTTHQRPAGAGGGRWALMQCATHLTLEHIRHVRLDVYAEPVDAVDRLLKLIRLGSFVASGLRQALSTERTQQQRQKQVQHLQSKHIR